VITRDSVRNTANDYYSAFEKMHLPQILLNNIRDSYADANSKPIRKPIPLPIQQHAIPHILKKRDVLGWSPTGTGKTVSLFQFLAFAFDNFCDIALL
jgi:superfamily II DNA/RNA helicase